MKDNQWSYDAVLVGMNIRKARKEAEMTIEQMAEALDKSTCHMNNIELGWSKMSMDLFVQLIHVLGVDANTLLGIDKTLYPGSEIEEGLDQLGPEARKYLKKIFLSMIQEFPI